MLDLRTESSLLLGSSGTRTMKHRCLSLIFREEGQTRMELFHWIHRCVCPQVSDTSGKEAHISYNAHLPWSFTLTASNKQLQKTTKVFYTSGCPLMTSQAMWTKSIGVFSHVLQTLVMLAAFSKVSARAVVPNLGGTGADIL